MAFRTRLGRRAVKAGLYLPDELCAALVSYYELLFRWNRKINLTALTDPDEAIDRLLLEPLVAVRSLPTPTARLLDVGSGGGSPAIPMKLASPGITLTMVEVKARKSAFLREAIRHLNLDRTTVETGRYEELLTRPELHESCDAVSVRAVRVEARSLLTLQAFLRPAGILMLFRGAHASDTQLVLPPLEHVQTMPLLEATHSHLMILRKHPTDGDMV